MLKLRASTDSSFTGSILSSKDFSGLTFSMSNSHYRTRVFRGGGDGAVCEESGDRSCREESLIFTFQSRVLENT